jgi:hypothetical protein
MTLREETKGLGVNIRKHCHSTVGNRTGKVDGKALVKPAPALVRKNVAHNLHDVRVAHAVTTVAGTPLDLQASPDDLVWVCGNGSNHFAPARTGKDCSRGELGILIAFAYSMSPHL